MVGLLLTILDIYCNRLQKIIWQSVNLYLHRTTKKSAAANEDCQRVNMALAVVITRPTMTFYKRICHSILVKIIHTSILNFISNKN